MSIRKLELFHIALPLKAKVKHASHERVESDSLVVRVTLTDGTVGYGEGVPRFYVTGETVETTFRALSAFDAARHFGDPADFPAVVRRAESMELAPNLDDARGMAANAARCALELAVLDAYGHRFQQSVSAAIRAADVAGLRLSARPTRVRYSGAITAASRGREVYSAVRMWLYGFRHIKLKVGVEGQDDARRLHTLRGVLGRPMDLRLDANEAWAPDTVVKRVRTLLPYRPSVIEQPVAHAEVGTLAEIRPRLGLPVMLDESLCGYPDAVRSIEDRTADLFNVRLSKCGGIIPTLRIIGLAQRSGVGLQLGCHPGETGLLSAAGRHLAGNVRGLRYVEGSYDRHILTHNLTVEDLTFGYGGLAPPLTGPGLGVRVEPSRLEALVVRSEEIRYD